MTSPTYARFAAMAVALVAVLATTGTADAHTGGASFDVIEASADADLMMHLRVAVSYEGDGEPAEQALVTATPTSPDGRSLAAVDLERGDGGVYAAAVAVDAPGKWSVLVTSGFPPGSTTIAVDVGGSDDDSPPVALIGVVAVVVAGGVVTLIGVRRRRRS